MKMLYAAKEAWAEQKYVEEYGAEQFFKDIETYEEILGKNWDDIIAEEQPLDIIAIHKKALAAIRLHTNQAI